MNAPAARLLGTVVIWAAMWIGTAYLLGGSPAFGWMLPLLLGGSAGSLLIGLAPSTVEDPSEARRSSA